MSNHLNSTEAKGNKPLYPTAEARGVYGLNSKGGNRRYCRYR